MASHEQAMQLLKTDLENKTAEHFNRSVELKAQQAQLDEQREKLELSKRETAERLAELEETPAWKKRKRSLRSGKRRSEN
ncbi:MAG: hypothetical protein ACLRSW_01285 [Christensenellaceae bacterium]